MKLLTTKEVCELLHISVDTLLRWRREGKFLQPHKPSGNNGKNLWLMSDIEEFMKGEK